MPQKEKSSTAARPFEAKPVDRCIRMCAGSARRGPITGSGVGLIAVGIRPRLKVKNGKRQKAADRGVLTGGGGTMVELEDGGPEVAAAVLSFREPSGSPWDHPSSASGLRSARP